MLKPPPPYAKFSAVARIDWLTGTDAEVRENASRRITGDGNDISGIGRARIEYRCGLCRTIAVDPIRAIGYPGYDVVPSSPIKEQGILRMSSGGTPSAAAALRTVGIGVRHHKLVMEVVLLEKGEQMSGNAVRGIIKSASIRNRATSANHRQ